MFSGLPTGLTEIIFGTANRPNINKWPGAKFGKNSLNYLDLWHFSPPQQNPPRIFSEKCSRKHVIFGGVPRVSKRWFVLCGGNEIPLPPCLPQFTPFLPQLQFQLFTTSFLPLVNLNLSGGRTVPTKRLFTESAPFLVFILMSGLLEHSFLEHFCLDQFSVIQGKFYVQRFSHSSFGVLKTLRS